MTPGLDGETREKQPRPTCHTDQRLTAITRLKGVRDGQQITMTASSRNSVFYQQFLQQIEDANPTGELWIVTDTCPVATEVPLLLWRP